MQKKPSKWVLLVPANLTIHDHKWFNAFKKDSAIEIEIYEFVELERIGVLNYQSEIALEFPELFPANEVAIKMGNSIVTTLKDMFIATNIATNNFETFIPLREFKAGNFSSISDEKR